jgi:hypothetical protein
MKDELAGDRFWRYQRQVSPGLQEYIEALSLAHYLEHGTLITLEQVQRSLSDDDGIPVRFVFFFAPVHVVVIHKRSPLISEVFPITRVGLPLGVIRPDWRIDENGDIRPRQERRPETRERCMRLCQGMQIRWVIFPLSHAQVLNTVQISNG